MLRSTLKNIAVKKLANDLVKGGVKGAVSTFALELNTQNKEIIMKKFILKKIISRMLFKKFSDKVILQEINADGFLIKHNTFGIFSILPKHLILSETTAIISCDVDVKYNKEKEGIMNNFTSGLIQGIASVAIIGLTGGFLGKGMAVSSLMTMGGSAIKLMNSSDNSFFGKNKTFEIPLPEYLENNTAYQKFIHNHPNGLDCNISITNSGMHLQVDNLNKEYLSELKDKSVAVLSTYIKKDDEVKLIK